jgi:AGZA family xanthine/uracil permease-like MFS transporter
MAYIVLVNPAILGQAGLPVASVAGHLLCRRLCQHPYGADRQHPLALAPGMGLNAYFSFTVVQTMHVPWPIALGCVFVSGAIFWC